MGKNHFKLYMEMLRLTKLGRQATKNPKGLQGGNNLIEKTKLNKCF